METNLLPTLREFFAVYEFYWSEWIIHEDCNLSRSEIELVDSLVDSQFLWQSSSNQNCISAAHVSSILNKLQAGYQVFKYFVILEFLCSIVRLAKNHSSGYVTFLSTKIDALDIDVGMKQALSKTKMENIAAIFLSHQVNDFICDPLYSMACDFLKAKKKTVEQISSLSKTV